MGPFYALRAPPLEAYFLPPLEAICPSGGFYVCMGEAIILAKLTRTVSIALWLFISYRPEKNNSFANLSGFSFGAAEVQRYLHG